MKTDSKSLTAALAKVAPGLHISVAWQPDLFFKWDGDGPDPRKRGYYPHNVTVTVQVILNGQKYDARNYLGGSYAKPGKPCPEIHGYWNQMVNEAISELPEFPGKAGALSLLHEARQISYDAQRREAAAV